MIKLDWSKFKKVAGDKNSTTMQHEDGHQIRIAHNVLSPKMRGELARLPSVKMAGGGMVDNEDEQDDEDEDMVAIKKEAPVEDDEDSEDGKNSELGGFSYAKGGMITIKKPKKMAEGGPVMQTGNKADDDEQARRRKASPDVGSQTQKGHLADKQPVDKTTLGQSIGYPAMADGGEVPVKKKTLGETIGYPMAEGGMTGDPRATPNGEVASPMTAAMMDMPAMSDAVPGAAGPTGLPPEMGGPGAADTGMTGVTGANPPLDPNSMDAMARGAPSATEKAAEQAKSPAEAAMREDASHDPENWSKGAPSQAMTDATTSAVASAPAPMASPAPPAAPGMSDPEKMMQSGIQGQISGLNDFAKAEQKLGAKRADIAQQQGDFLNKSLSTYQEEKSKIDGEVNAALDDVRNKHIDPDRFWSNKSSFSKIMSGIGVVMAGYAAGVNGGENQALKYMQKQIDNDIESQKADMTKSENLLSYNFKKYGNLKDATEMTRATMMAVTASQFEKAAADAQGPEAQARAKIASSEVKAKYAPILEKQALMTTVNRLKGDIADPNKATTLFNAVQQYDPKQAADLRNRYIPGLGLANTAEDRNTIVTGKAANDSMNSQIQHLLEITKRPLKSLSPQERAEAETTRMTLLSAVRTPMFGQRFNQGELDLLLKLIPDTTSMFTLDTSNRARLSQLQQDMNMKFRNEVKSRGVALPADQSAPENKISMRGGKAYRLDPTGKYMVPVK